MKTRRKSFANAGALLTSEVSSRATTFFVYALVARYLGADDFGRFSLALTLFYLFQVVAMAGLKSLVAREVAAQPSDASRYLINGSLVVIGASVLAAAGLALFVGAMDYAGQTASAVLLLSLGLLPYSLSAVCEGTLQGLERMYFIAVANVFGNVAKAGFSIMLIWQGYGLLPILAVIVCCYAAVLILEWTFLARSVTFQNGGADLSLCLILLKKGGTFLGIDALIAFGLSMSVLILAGVATERDVGLFSSVNQLLVPVAVVFSSIMLSIAPALYRNFAVKPLKVQQIGAGALELLMSIAIPSAIALFFLADQILPLLYGGRDFAQATDVMRIMCWTLIPLALTWPLGQVLVASLQEKAVLKIVAVNTVVGLIVGLILTYFYGLLGAGVAVMITRLIDALQHYWRVRRLHPELRIGPLIRKPVCGGAAMSVVLQLFGEGAQIFAILGSVVVYTGCIFVLNRSRDSFLRQVIGGHSNA